MSKIPGWDLCETAKKGKLCPDDLCHGVGVTLCGFDKDAYEEMVSEEFEEPFIDEFENAVHTVPTCEHCGAPANVGCSCTSPDLARAVIPKWEPVEVDEFENGPEVKSNEEKMNDTESR